MWYFHKCHKRHIAQAHLLPYNTQYKNPHNWNVNLLQWILLCIRAFQNHFYQINVNQHRFDRGFIMSDLLFDFKWHYVVEETRTSSLISDWQHAERITSVNTLRPVLICIATNICLLNAMCNLFNIDEKTPVVGVCRFVVKCACCRMFENSLFWCSPIS